ncbi:MAG: hypothetical protein KAH24_01300, partial [Holophagae bacterium]|nr:hypothetical protein [Holophagae bacterium]
MHRLILILLFVGSFAGMSLADSVSLVVRDKNIRHAWFRGEIAGLLLEVENRSGKDLSDVDLVVRIDDLLCEAHRFDLIEVDSKVSHLFRIDTSAIRSGSYTAACLAAPPDETGVQTNLEFLVARRWNPDRMRVWLWPHHKFGKMVHTLNEQAKEVLTWYANVGFNSFNPGGGINGEINYGGIDEKFSLYDYALTQGYEMGFSPYRVFPSEGSFCDDIDDDQKYDAKHKIFNTTRIPDPFQPEVVELQSKLNRNLMEAIREFSGVGVCFLESETEDHLPGDTPMARQSLPVPYGPTVPHRFVFPGVIADNDEKYVRHTYRYSWGDGMSIRNERAVKMVHRYRADIMTFADPLRRTELYERFRGLDTLSTWTYTTPDPKLMLYAETLIACGKPFGQGFMHTITLLNYAGKIAPKEAGWTVMGPDRLVETSWINLSRRPDGLSVYIGSPCDPLDPKVEEPYGAYLPTFNAFGEFVKTVVQPYGPMIGKLKRTPRRTAVLSSQATQVYSESPPLWGHYSPYNVYGFYILLSMIHVPADIVFDQTVSEFGLDEYDILVLPRCETLTQTVYERILAFQKRGGLIVSDQYLRAPIPDVVKCDFDFTHRKNVTAMAITENSIFTGGGDTLKERTSKQLAVKGVTAKEDQEIMEGYAKQLKEKLSGLVPVKVECSSPTALVNTLQSGPVEYLFVINDKRTYGDRLGEHKAMLEKALPQTVEMTMNERSQDNLYVYDLLEKKLLETTGTNSNVSFTVDLPAPGGKIIALMNQKIDRVEVLAPETCGKMESIQIQVLIRDDQDHLIAGVQPVELTLTDPDGNVNEYSDFYAAESGVLSVPFTVAKNDKAG